MIALLGVLSFLGFIVCIVLTIINVIRKKTVKSVAIGIAVCFVILVICLALTPEGENTKTEKIAKQTEGVEKQTTGPKTEEVETVAPAEETVAEITATDDTKKPQNQSEPVSKIEESKIEEKPIKDQETKPETKEVKKVEYDNLQKVFLAITEDTTEEEILALISEFGLEYTVQDYNGTPKTNHYKLAYEQDVALQRYAEEGDNLEISFNKEDASLMYAEYFNHVSFKAAIYYRYGIHWEFREEEPNNNYTGYYYHTPGESKGGITIKYNNGYSTETGYHDVNSGEDALANIL